MHFLIICVCIFCVCICMCIFVVYICVCACFCVCVCPCTDIHVLFLHTHYLLFILSWMPFENKNLIFFVVIGFGALVFFYVQLLFPSVSADLIVTFYIFVLYDFYEIFSFVCVTGLKKCMALLKWIFVMFFCGWLSDSFL